MLTIVKTDDGSCTFKNALLDETYHSMNGALTESLHVFIKNGLHKYESKENEINILEVGLGTGLNALMTLDNIPDGKTVNYVASEPFPIEIPQVEEYFSQFENKPKHLDLLTNLLSSGIPEFSKLTKHFNFKNFSLPIQSISLSDLQTTFNNSNKTFNGFDIIYFDAFAPQKQSELWEPEVFALLTGWLKYNGIITTYCAQGQFRRNLKSLGLSVESLPGPPGKREMTVAKKTTY